MELFDRTNAPKRADTWFVYALVDSRAPEEIRYIGITNNPRRRLGRHAGETSGPRKVRWMRSVANSGGQVMIGILRSGLTHLDAKFAEIAEIASHRDLGHKLTNLTDGGDGIVGLWDNPDHREKMSALGKARFRDVAERRRNARITRDSWADPAIRRSRTTGVRKVRGTVESRMATAMLSRLAPPTSANKSGYKGVFFSGAAKKWTCQIKLDGKSKYIGLYTTPEEAARAYDKAAHAAWGSDCYLNFPADLAA